MDAASIQDLVTKIDTSKTVIQDYCPEYLQDEYLRCEATRYRDLEGRCNNLENPHWGASLIAHSRFLPAAFTDGISAPRISVLGKELPSARLVRMIQIHDAKNKHFHDSFYICSNCQVSAHVHRDDGFHDHALTFLFVAWGQFTDHDITLTSEIDEVEEEDLNCCNGNLDFNPILMEKP